MRQTIAKVFIMILVTSCLEQNEFQKQNQFEINFDKEAFSIVTGTDFNVDWNSGTNYFSEDLGMDYLEFPVVIEDNSGNIKGNYRINFTLLATQKDENNFEFYMVKFYEETRNTSAFVENISFSETEKFSGLVHVLDKNNELYFARKLKNGAILDQNLFSRENKSSDNSSRMQEDCYTVTTYHYTDWYVNGAYVDSWLNNITHETYCYSYYLPDLFTSGGGGSGSYGSNGGDAYDNCGDPIHGCIYKIKNETLVDFYTCPENFTFSTATNSNLWQEAALTNVYTNLVYWVGNTGERAIRKVSLDKVYFGLPYYNVEGELVYSNRNAAEISADVLNIAEYEMRNKFKDNPQLTSYELAQYWLERMKHHMNEISTNRDRVDKYGSTNNPVPVVHRAYAPC